MSRPRIAIASLLAAAVAAAAALIIAPAGHRAAPTRPAGVPATFHPTATPQRVRERRARAARRLGKTGVVQSDRRTGGARFVGRLDGFLTKASDRDPKQVALGYVRRHRDVFGLDEDDLAQLQLADRSTSHGVKLLRWTQESGGVPLLEGSLRAAVTEDGRLVNVTGGARHDLPEPGTPKLDGAAAKAAAAKASGGTTKGMDATLVFTAATGDIKLAWRVMGWQGAQYLDQLIDARTGAEISRRDRVDHAVPGLVYDTYPGAPIAGTPRTIDLEPYLFPGVNELEGPRASVWPDINGNNIQETTEHVFKTGTGDFKYTRNAFRVEPECPTAGCSWSPHLAGSASSNTRQAAVQMFALLGQYSDHLASAPIGFDGFKHDLTGVDNDPVIANVMDGINGPNGLPDVNHINNAGMYTPPDHNSPMLTAFLFWEQDKYAAVNPVDDASVVYHEYTHGLIGRTVVDAQGWQATSLLQSAALNEGLADFFSLDYLVGRGLMTDTAAPGELWVGQHLYKPGVGRKQAMDCPRVVLNSNCMFQLAAPGGLSYEDYGQVDERGPEPHYDGEILAQTMWQLRTALLNAYGEQEGKNRIRSLAYMALQLSPPDPSFLDYRNALLQADHVLRQGQDAQRIWEVFADRGMGWYASTADADDAHPKADRQPGPGGITGQGTLSGIVTDRDTGAPLAGIRVALGGHTTDNAQAPGPFDTETDADGRYRFSHVPAGSYGHLIARDHNYAEQIAEDIEIAGEVRQDIRLRRNWADVHGGAVIAGTDLPQLNGCGLKQMVDGNRMSGWTTKLVNRDEGYIDIALPQALRVTSFGMDPTPRTVSDPESPGACMLDDGARATRIRIEVASSQGGPWKEAVNEAIDKAHLRRLSELRPAAAIDDVRYVRVHLYHPINQQADPRLMSFAELQVYSASKRPPRAIFDYGPKPLDVAQAATFDATRSRAGDAPIARYEWDLDGNGSFETDGGTTPTATHSYTETGRYNVGLRVTDANGEQDELRALVLVAHDYEIMDLGTTAPDDSGAAHATYISEGGASAVTLGHPGELDQMPGRFDGGAVQPLELPAGRVFGTVFTVNDRGQSVGNVYPVRQFAQVDAALWNGSQPTVLGTLGGSSATAVGINNNGWVVGWAMDDKSVTRGYLKRLGNPMVDVQEEAGVPAAQRKSMKLVKINDNGLAVGCNGYERAGEGCGHAVTYDALTHTLTQLPDPGFGGGASGVSADGHTVTGMTVDLGRIARATVWRDGVPQIIPGVPGGDSLAMGVNSDGTVITGHLGTLKGYGAWIYENGKTTMLDSLVPDTGWHLKDADGLNDRKEIVGLGTIDGKERAYQLNLGPCRVCVTDVRLEDHDLPAGNWQSVGADGTVEGNVVRVHVHVENHDDQPHIFQLKARDETRKQALPGTAPTISLDPGEEDWVELEWDTEGLAWQDGKADADHILRVRAVLGHSIYSGRSAVLKVRPRPVVLVPGALEDASVWKEYAARLVRTNPEWEAFPVPGLQTGSWGNLAHAPDTLDRHSEVVQAFVKRVREDEDAEHVDVVAHGLGGLIARQWIQDGMPDGVVEHLVQLGTPNLGTPCAEVIDAGPFYDLRRDVMDGFNARVTERRGVEFSAFAGDVDAYTCIHGTERGDMEVPVSSAKWTIQDAVVGEVSHVEMPASGSLFTDFVKPRLIGEEGAPSVAAARRAAAEEPPAATPRSHQLLAQTIATVAPGAVAEVPLAVDGGSQLDVTLLAPPKIKAELVRPDGAVVDAAPAGTTRALSADEPEPGQWKVRLRSTGDAPLQVALAASLRDDPWFLDLRRGRAAADGALPMVAAITRFDRRVTDGAVTLEVQRRGTAAESVTLLDDGQHGDGLPGDGCYGGAPVIAAGEALLRLRVKRAGDERVRSTWIDARPGEVEGRAPTCPDLRGRNGEIAYAQHNANWATVDPDDVIRELPLNGSRIPAARWSRDGRRLAWTLFDDVYVGKPDATEPQLIVGGDNVRRADVAWSP
ncbi:MAG TPA: M36 family metallopeptidase, partial [Solirubrobacteraceae bacterium]|nr:M36 family metallopeptidase [Solirubrobacteraceae bacterium]